MIGVGNNRDGLHPRTGRCMLAFVGIDGIIPVDAVADRENCIEEFG